MHTILVVDDERVIREGCRRVLSAEGYQVFTAASGEEALEVLNTEEVAVVLCDLKMPGMSALDVLDAIKEHHPGVPLIVITGHGTVTNAVECMKRGAYEFITKPFQPDHLLLIVRRALEKQELERRNRELQEAHAKNLYDLSTEKSRIRTLTDCMADGVLVTNRELEVVLHNAAIMRLLEIPTELPDPGKLSDYLDEEDFTRELSELMQGDNLEVRFKSREMIKGTTHMRVISAPMLGPEREILGTVTIFHDITRLKQLDEMKTNFLHMVSHELRSPLAAIKQQIAVILEGLAGEVTEKQHELLGRAQEKIQSLLDLVNDLLDVAKIESGQSRQEHVDLDLGKVLRDTVALLNARAEKQGVTLKLQLPASLPHISADPRSMEELFTNLITNAVNYSPDGGEVTISVHPYSDYMEVSVKDTGVGIEAEEIPKIFSKFYRVKHPRTRRVMGTGLGLAIVKGIVDSHRGSIRVESTPGVGTTFRVFLPSGTS